jgi:hypothetical protein
VNGFQSVSAETLNLIRGNLRAGLDRVAESLTDGTFHTCGPKGSAPPAQSGRLTLALLDSLDAELASREQTTTTEEAA